MADRKAPNELVVLAAVALCCALPAVVLLAGGLLASSWGLAMRFWPVFGVGAALLILGGVGLANRVRRETRGSSQGGGSSS
jgi:hypothetical protein